MCIASLKKWIAALTTNDEIAGSISGNSTFKIFLMN